MLYFGKTHVSKVLTIIKQVHQKSVLFAALIIFYIKGWSFNKLSGLDVMIY